jgi:hypothetical protein
MRMSNFKKKKIFFKKYKLIFFLQYSISISIEFDQENVRNPITKQPKGRPPGNSKLEGFRLILIKLLIGGLKTNGVFVIICLNKKKRKNNFAFLRIIYKKLYYLMFHKTKQKKLSC